MLRFIAHLWKRRQAGSIERGNAGLELAAWLPVLGLFISGILLAARLFYVHIGVATATGDCSMNGAQVTDNRDGVGWFAGLDTLAYYGLGDPVWGMARPEVGAVVCQMDYREDLPPVSGPLAPQIEMQHRAMYPIQCYKSVWDSEAVMQTPRSSDCPIP